MAMRNSSRCCGVKRSQSRVNRGCLSYVGTLGVDSLPRRPLFERGEELLVGGVERALAGGDLSVRLQLTRQPLGLPEPGLIGVDAVPTVRPQGEREGDRHSA